jgi:D-xylose 1-dehydrogenase (NADP+, D-xylono-1,5-lactone-forming)
MAKVRWGVLSTASIGRLVIEAARAADHAEFVAVASRDPARARAFAGELGLEASFGSYEELLASGTVDAVYVPLPVALHTEWTVKALAAGKHVLCEKPLATSAAGAARCLDAAEAAGRRCVEGLMWRHHPQTTLARELVAGGAIGRLAYVRAALSVSVAPGDIRRSVALGGGALGDLGCYCVSAIRLFAGEPSRVTAVQVRDRPDGAGDADAGVDLRLAATLRLPGDVLAQFDVALDLTRRDELELVGTEGRLTVPDPWLCRSPHLELSRNGRVERVPVDPDGAFGLTDPEHDVYRIELDAVSAAIAGGGEPSFGRSDAVAQATVLEALYRSAELGRPVDLVGV